MNQISSSALRSSSPDCFCPNARLYDTASSLLATAGIAINGNAPWDIQLRQQGVLERVFDQGNVGLGEACMEVAHRCLKDDGLFLLHTIGKNVRASVPDPWIDKYIFPNGALPSIGQIGDAVDGLFVAEDLHNFGADYDKTLMAWCRNFESAWPRFSAQLGERFYRMWRYYLLSCAGAFRARDIQLWQWVFSRQGITGGYRRLS